jgi:hypothetical protein
MTSILDKTPGEIKDNILTGNIIKPIERYFKQFSAAVLFWYSVLYLAFFVVLAVWPVVAGFIFLGGSALLIVFVLDMAGDKDTDWKLLWMPLTVIFWAFFVTMLIFCAGEWMYRKTIVPFNAWLNTKRNKS